MNWQVILGVIAALWIASTAFFAFSLWKAVDEDKMNNE